jgi:hypothetical protein
MLGASKYTVNTDRRSTLNVTRCIKHWVLKLENHLSIEWFPLLNILSFQSFHNSHAASRVISVTKNKLLFCITWYILSSMSKVGSHYISMRLQHWMAKSQMKKRCSIVSFTPMLHMTQRSFSLAPICLLVRYNVNLLKTFK